MKKFLLTVILTMIGFVALAQAMDEVVYLKNGSVIRGIIIEQIPNESLKIKTKDGNLFVFQYDEIAKITKEESLTDDYTALTIKKVIKYNDKGMYNDVNLGFAFGNYEDIPIVDLQYTVGYKFNRFIGVGFGTGFKYDTEGLSIPLFANIRSEFLRGPVVPYMSANIGYNASISGLLDGLYIEDKIGVLFGRGKARFNLGLSYTINNASLTYYYDPQNYYFSSTILESFRLSFGVTF